MADKFKHIIEEELAVSAEDFPTEPGDENAWHFDHEQIWNLLGRVAERVEEDAAIDKFIRLRSQRDESRKVARDAHRTAKKWHAKHWGEENAEIAFRDIEAQYPWLSDLKEPE